jgi:branched-chain amino acid aminotransferase
MAKPLHPPSPELYRNGVTLIVAETRRNLPSALSPRIKATNFLNNILAKREAIAAGAFDSILLNWEDHLTECTVSNLFFVADGCLHTPSVECGLLDGITRSIVIQLAKEQHIPTEEGCFTPAHLYRARESFVTNTSMEIMPVIAVDGKQIGTGKPGSLTQNLHELFIGARERFWEIASPR